MRGRKDPIAASETLSMLEDGQQPMYSIHADNRFQTSEEGFLLQVMPNEGHLWWWAIWEGREAARSIDQYLMGESAPTSPQAEFSMKGRNVLIYSSVTIGILALIGYALWQEIARNESQIQTSISGTIKTAPSVTGGVVKTTMLT